MININKSRKIIADNIKFYRIKLNWTQEQFAEKLGTKITYLSEIENCKRNTSIDYLDHIADTLNIETYKLLEKNNKLFARKVPRK